MNELAQGVGLYRQYITATGRIIDSDRSPWFRVKGDRKLYRFLSLDIHRNARGKLRAAIHAVGPEGEFRAFNVGPRYRNRGWLVPHYRVRAAKPPKDGKHQGW